MKLLKLLLIGEGEGCCNSVNIEKMYTLELLIF